MNRRRALGLIGASTTAAWLASRMGGDGPREAYAQVNPVSWRLPAVVFKTDEGVTWPKVVADSVGDIHLMFIHSRGGGSVVSGEIMYACYSAGQWSTPIDVLLSPDSGRVANLSIAIDRRGYLHVAWIGGLGDAAYYSRCHISRAQSARAWTRPVEVFESIAIGVDVHVASNDTIHLICTKADGRVSYRRSQDGDLWLAPSTVTNYRDDRQFVGPGPVRIAADRRGRLHAVWAELVSPAGWPPLGVTYARSIDGGTTWEDPTVMDQGVFSLINVLVAEDDTVHLLWHGGIGKTEDRRYLRSLDGGETWGEPEQVVPTLRGGLTGMSPFAFDGSGILHVITSVDEPRRGTIGEETIRANMHGSVSGVFHTIRQNGIWAPPTFVSRQALGQRSVELPALTVSLGNQLHVVYEDDFQRIWHVIGTMNTPGQAVRAVPGPVSKPTATPILAEGRNVSALPGARPTATSGVPSGPPAGPASVAEQPPFVVGLLSSAALVAFATAVTWLRRR